jgi:hypothetical protein
LNKPFTVTENPWFTRLLRVAGHKGKILKADIIRNKLFARVDNVRRQIIDDIKATATTICLTLNAWTSKNKKAMLAINIQWLDNNFKRHQYCIKFIKIKGTYSGENLAKIVHQALKDFKCRERLFTITSDNASNNNTLCSALHTFLLKEFNDYLELFPLHSKSIRFRGDASRIRCFVHILNLIVKAILVELGSSTQKAASEYLDRAAALIANQQRRTITLPSAQGVIAKLRITILWIYRSA